MRRIIQFFICGKHIAKLPSRYYYKVNDKDISLDGFHLSRLDSPVYVLWGNLNYEVSGGVGAKSTDCGNVTEE